LALAVIRKIHLQCRYNIYENGVVKGKWDNGLFLGDSDDDFVPQKVPGSHTWTSIIETVNMLGSSLPLLVTLKALTIQHQWFPEDLEEFVFHFIRKGHNEINL